MPRTWSLWSDTDGDATWGLRRFLTRGFGVLFLTAALACTPGPWLRGDPTSRAYLGLACALLLITAVRCLRGAIEPIDLAPAAAAVAVASLIPDLTGSRSGAISGTLYAIWLVAAVANLSPRPARWALVASLGLFLTLTWVGSTQPVSTALDTSLLNAGVALAGSAFIGALVERARLQDALTDELTTLEVAAAVRELEQASSDNARRVLHDEVLGALRAIAELPEEERPQVQGASRQAATAVRYHLGET